jgi:hypothetical protein
MGEGATPTPATPSEAPQSEKGAGGEGEGVVIPDPGSAVPGVEDPASGGSATQPYLKGEEPKGSISGSVFALGGSGERTPTDGVSVLLNGSKATVTSNGGRFSFDNLPLGTYTISEVVPQGYRAVYPAYGISEPITITATDRFKSGVDFVNAPVTQ